MHTPGPWSFRLYTQTEEEIALLKQIGREPTKALDNEGSAAVMAAENLVARVVLQREDVKRADRWNADDEERDANAHLIAAAPELYDALVHAANIIAQYVPERAMGVEGNWHVRDAYLHEMRAALAKAEGKQ